MFIDSVSGSVSELPWIVPNLVSDQARIRVETFDVVDLSTSDTVVLSIDDGISPTFLFRILALDFQ